MWAIAADHADGVICVEAKSAFVLVARAVVREEDVIGACAGRSWKTRGRGAGLVALGGGKKCVRFVTAVRRRVGETKRCGQLRRWFWTSGKIWQKKGQLGKQQ